MQNAARAIGGAPHRVDLRPLLRDGPRQPLGARRARPTTLLVDGRGRASAPRPRGRRSRRPTRAARPTSSCKPTAIVDRAASPRRIADGDVVVFMNFRADRAREITRALTDAGVRRLPAARACRDLAAFVCLTQLRRRVLAAARRLPARSRCANGFGEYLATLGLTQLRIAETEKYAHVTYLLQRRRRDAVSRARTASWCRRPRSRPTTSSPR